MGTHSKRLPAARAADIAPFHVMEVLARAKALERAGRHIIHMEVGEPDFHSPGPVLQAGQVALRNGQTHYTPAVGLGELREAIAAFYQHRYGVAVPPERVVVTPGAAGALQLAVAALVDPGDNVVLTDPGYPCNRHLVSLLGGRPINVPVGPDSGYQLTPQLLERFATSETAAVLIASPSNPTGTMVSEEQLRRLVADVPALGGHLIVDEIYHGLVYEGNYTTALDLSDDLFVINSFSKYFGMTGWRLGWLVAPESHLRCVEKLAQNLFIAPSTIAQHAALAAFLPETLALLEERRQAFRERRDFLLPALERLGFAVPVVPQGAFYIYADCSRFTSDSRSFALRLLEDAGVALTPGVDFGSYRAAQHVRFAYTTALTELEEGVARLKRFLGQ
jgi:aspartate/methionine/tyrosine aminotransferase